MPNRHQVNYFLSSIVHFVKFSLVQFDLVNPFRFMRSNLVHWVHFVGLWPIFFQFNPFQSNSVHFSVVTFCFVLFVCVCLGFLFLFLFFIIGKRHKTFI